MRVAPPTVTPRVQARRLVASLAVASLAVVSLVGSVDLSAAGATPPAAVPSTTSSSTPAAPGTGGTPAAPGAPGCTPVRLAADRLAVSTGLTERVQRLALDQHSVTVARLLTPGDRATLTTDLANERTGLDALVAKAPGAATCQALRADAVAMENNFRVYLVMTPQVHITAVADAESAVAAQLAALEPIIAAAIDRAQQPGTSVAGPRVALADLEARVATAQHSLAGLAGTVLSYTPASYPGCWSAFMADRQRLIDGATELRRAATDLRTLMVDMRQDGIGQAAPAATTTTTTG